ncbi:hypothetical protein N658DRAFT_525199 [Parathielavia hyrcaniae]|uniref:Uncharacterized protein n=1 Tax=Parathielavia hyrcaniae TaxID=113614 RepID=A0AAN6T0M8_9PEZI|nr:hypothetical protein N658DRAFT_525199 [Parathielavia hyrcaniae]
MGTRHLICVFWKGKWVLAQYGQFDGYPEGQGVKVFKFLSVARNIDNFKAGLEHHIYEPNQEELNAIWAECILGIIARASQPQEDADSAELKPKKVPVNLQLTFANHTLFCEWAYVIDLDKEVLEVYGGGEHKHDGHRFKDVGDKDADVPAFVYSYGFNELYLTESENEFLEKIKQACDQKNDGDEAEDDFSLRESDGDDDEDGKDADKQIVKDETKDEDAQRSAKGSP